MRGGGETRQEQSMADAGNSGLGGRRLDQIHCTKTNEYLRKPPTVDITQICYLKVLIHLTEKGNHTADA